MCVAKRIFTVLFTQQSQFILTLFFITFFPTFRRILTGENKVLRERRGRGEKTRIAREMQRVSLLLLLLHRFIRVNPLFYLVYSLLSLANSKMYELWRRNKLCLRLSCQRRRVPGVTTATTVILS